MVTEEPGKLVKISLNTHDTRVVKKLIETLETRQQISLAISALEPGFLSLIKDQNGNHVVQRCLQCLSSEDNNFIFDAAARYCVDITTHQHGFCVLQRCISHSNGEYKRKLVEEISTIGLLLAQDAYGNCCSVHLGVKNPTCHFNFDFSIRRELCASLITEVQQPCGRKMSHGVKLRRPVENHSRIALCYSLRPVASRSACKLRWSNRCPCV